MFPDVLRRLYSYNGWATGRVLDAAEPLTPEQLHAPGQAGMGSIRDTLLHLLATHRGWLSWWDGSLSAEEAYALNADPADFPDVPALRRFLAEIQQQTEAFVSELEGDDPGRVYAWELPDGRRWEMPLWGMMQHIVNHSTQHRAEAAAMLTAFGHSPGDLDLIFYLAQPLDAPTDEPAAGRQWATETA
jgi:uncharacterized damage-inducible protein DinB